MIPPLRVREPAPLGAAGWRFGAGSSAKARDLERVMGHKSQSRVEVQAIGAGAINQAVKAIAISRGYVAAGGFDLVCIPSFIDITIEGEERTGIRLLVESR